MVASRLCRDEGKMRVKMGFFVVFVLFFYIYIYINNFKIRQKVAGDETDLRRR